MFLCVFCFNKRDVLQREDNPRGHLIIWTTCEVKRDDIKHLFPTAGKNVGVTFDHHYNQHILCNINAWFMDLTSACMRLSLKYVCFRDHKW